MHLVKILKYVAVSFENKPSFLLLMSDNKEYISNGCQFVENTENNIKYLLNKYDCEKYLNELLNSEVLGDYNSITDASFMLDGCNSLTSFSLEAPNLTNARSMLKGCTNLTSFSLEAPNLTNASYMLYCCTSLTSFSLEAPNLTNVSFMLKGCTSLNN